MTFTREREKLISTGNQRGKQCDLNISSYTTGGETIDAAGLGIDSVPTHVDITLLGTTARHATWDRTNNKILVYDAAGTQIAAATNLGAVVSIRAYIP